MTSARSSAASASSRCCAALGAHAAGEGGVVVLAGEAGMGKTRLAARFAAEAHAGGAAVLHGRIDEEAVVPYQPFVEALRHYAALAGDHGTATDVEALAPLVPELGAGGAAPEPPAGERENRRYRLFEAVAALLGQAAGERPLLLVVEDLQWAGRPTLLLLRHVVRRLHGAPLMVLVTLRDAEADPAARPRGCSPTSAASTSSSAWRSRAWRRRRPPSSSATPSSRAACRAAPPATRSSSRRCCAASRRRPRSRRASPRASRTSSRGGSRGWSRRRSRR